MVLSLKRSYPKLPVYLLLATPTLLLLATPTLKVLFLRYNHFPEVTRVLAAISQLLVQGRLSRAVDS